MIGKVVDGKYAGCGVHKLPDRNIIYISKADGSKFALNKSNAESIEDITEQYPSSGRKTILVVWKDYESSVIQFGVEEDAQGKSDERSGRQEHNQSKEVLQVSKKKKDHPKLSKPNTAKSKKKTVVILTTCTILLVFTMVALYMTTKFCFEHEWENASCTVLKTCSKCGKTEGVLLPHDWKSATCTAPKTCKDCGATEGKTVPHEWRDATCTSPKACINCESTEGVAIDHSWQEATCENPETCSVCGETKGDSLGHIEGETKMGDIDCENAVLYWDCYCQRCQNVMSSTEEKMTTLHENGVFLMSPVEFAHRLGTAFDNTTQVDMGAGYMDDDGKFLLRIIDEGNVSGLGQLVSSEKSSIIPYNMKDRHGSFNMALVQLSDDLDLCKRVVLATIMACDPSVDINQAKELMQRVMSSEEVYHNDIMYFLVRVTDLGTYAFSFGIPSPNYTK